MKEKLAYWDRLTADYHRLDRCLLFLPVFFLTFLKSCLALLVLLINAFSFVGFGV